MSVDRQALEQLALRICSSEIYYDLADKIAETGADELWAIIDCNGDYKKELEIIER